MCVCGCRGLYARHVFCHEMYRNVSNWKLKEHDHEPIYFRGHDVQTNAFAMGKHLLGIVAWPQSLATIPTSSHWVKSFDPLSQMLAPESHILDILGACPESEASPRRYQEILEMGQQIEVDLACRSARNSFAPVPEMKSKQRTSDPVGRSTWSIPELILFYESFTFTLMYINEK